MARADFGFFLFPHHYPIFDSRSKLSATRQSVYFLFQTAPSRQGLWRLLPLPERLLESRGRRRTRGKKKRTSWSDLAQTQKTGGLVQRVEPGSKVLRVASEACMDRKTDGSYWSMRTWERSECIGRGPCSCCPAGPGFLACGLL